jgi:putative hemolysin
LKPLHHAIPGLSTHLDGSIAGARPANWRFHACWADSESDLQAAQALRYQVFAVELGARLAQQAVDCGRDIDRFDAYCDHLLVWAVDAGGQSPRELVGTYRVLGPEAARRAGGLYAEQEFDLSPLTALRPRMIELGRACVAPAWRSGGVILALWTALGQYMVRRELETMVGCASVGLLDGGGFAHALWQTLRQTHLVDAEWLVAPRIPLTLPAGAAHAAEAAVPLPMRAMPPLIKGYLRGGARVLGPPAYDRDFHTADLPIMMRRQELSPRYRAQFLLP